MEAEHSKGHHFPIVASPINISTPVPSSLYVTQRDPSMIAQNQVSSYNSLIITDFLIHGRSLKCQIQVFMSLNILEYLLLFVGSTTSSTVQPATAETGKAL